MSLWLNLVRLMTPTSWAWTLASLATVALCFNVASLVVRRWMGMRLENIEIDLYPLRWASYLTNMLTACISSTICRVYYPNTPGLVQRGKARVPERTILYSFNLLWLLWAVCGGIFVTNFLLSNYLAILIKPVLEEPVDTVQVKRGSDLLLSSSCPLALRMCMSDP